MTKVSQRIYAKICVPFEAAGAIASKSDGLEKFAKLLASIIDGMNTIFTRFGKPTAMAATMVMKGKLKIVADVISGLNFINRLFEWVCPEPGKTKPFWMAETKTTKERFALNTKIIGRVFLTAAHFIDFIKLLDAFGLITLGRITTQTIGRVPVLNLAKDVFVVVASGFAITNNLITLTDATPRWNHARKKMAQWKEVGEVLQAGGATGRDDGDLSAAGRRNVQNRLAKKCSEKAEHYSAEHDKIVDKLSRNCRNPDLIEQLVEDNFATQDERNAHVQLVIGDSQDTNLARKLIAKRSDMAAKHQKWQSQILVLRNASGRRIVLRGGVEGYCDRKLERAIARAQVEVDERQAALDNARGPLGGSGEKHEVDSALLRRPMAELATSEAARDVLVNLRDTGNVDRFINHRYEVFKAEETTAFRKVTKCWVGIAYDIAKIAIIAFAITGLALGLASFGWSMTIFALALTVNSIGVFKFLYEELVAKKEVKKPRLQAAAAAP